MVLTNSFHPVDSFSRFSRIQASTNSVAPYFCIQTTQNPQFLDSLRRRANARNVSFRISLRWPINVINSVDKTKLAYYTSHRRSTTVSLETCPSGLWYGQAKFEGTPSIKPIILSGLWFRTVKKKRGGAVSEKARKPEKASNSLRRRAYARNVSFRISLRWPIHIIISVDKIKLAYYTSHRRSTTVSLELAHLNYDMAERNSRAPPV